MKSKFTACIIPGLLAVAFCMFSGCSSGESARQIDIPIEEIKDIETPEEVQSDPVMLLARGEYLYARKRYNESLIFVQQVLAGFQETLHSDHAYYLKGLIYGNVLNFHMDLDQAAAAFRMVISSPPESDFDGMAEDRLEEIEKRRKKD